MKQIVLYRQKSIILTYAEKVPYSQIYIIEHHVHLFVVVEMIKKLPCNTNTLGFANYLFN